MNHQYYCQTQIQNILDHIIPIPNDFKVSDQYLCGLKQEEFVNGFKNLREILIDIYKDMQKTPEEYGLICTSLEVTGFAEIIKKSKVSAAWLMMLLYNFCMAGEVSERVLVIDPVLYTENTKIKWVGGNKVKSPVQIIHKLQEFGFSFEGLKGDKFDKKAEKFVLSFPEKPVILTVLKSFIMTASASESRKFNDNLIHLDYKQFLDPARRPSNQDFLDYLTYLDGSDKEFFEKLHLGLIENSYTYKPDYEYRMRYLKKEKDKNYTVECQSYHRKLFIGMKLKHMDKYSDFVLSLPEHIKKMFMRNSCRPGCDFQGATAEKCRFRVTWRIDGVEYKKCSFEDVFVPPVYNPEEVDYYIKLLILDKNS